MAILAKKPLVKKLAKTKKAHGATKVTNTRTKAIITTEKAIITTGQPAMQKLLVRLVERLIANANLASASANPVNALVEKQKTTPKKLLVVPQPAEHPAANANPISASANPASVPVAKIKQVQAKTGVGKVATKAEHGAVVASGAVAANGAVVASVASVASASFT